MIRGHRGLALAAAVGAALAGCGDDTPTVVVIEVSARTAVTDVATLEVVAENGTESIQTSFELDGRDLPVSFSITPTGRTGELAISIRAVDDGGLLRGLGSAATEIVTDGRADAALLLDPADFVVNSSIAGDQRLTFLSERNGKQLAAFDNQFAAVFVNDCAQLGRCDVFGRRFDGDGLPAGNGISMDAGEFIANLSDEIASAPAVALGTDGSFIAWETPTDIRGVALGPDGGHLGFVETIVSPEDQTTADAVVAAVAAGDYVVAWSTSSGGAIRGRLIESTGEPRVNPVTNDNLDFPIATQASGTAVRPSLSSTGDGHGFVAVWRHDESVRARFFDRNAAPLAGSDAALVTYGATAFVRAPHVAWSDDTALVVWGVSDFSVPELEEGRYLYRRFSTNGSPIGPERVLDPDTPSFGSAPDVAVLPNGLVGATWHNCDAAGDGAGCGIRFQLLRPTGLPIGPVATANTTTAGDQTDPSIAPLGGDAFAVVWTDESSQAPDASGSAVRGRVLYPELDPTDGRLGARCGQNDTAPCADGLTCVAGSDGAPYCHESCDPEGPAPQCPLGGICSTSGGSSACLF